MPRYIMGLVVLSIYIGTNSHSREPLSPPSEPPLRSPHPRSFEGRSLEASSWRSGVWLPAAGGFRDPGTGRPWDPPRAALGPLCREPCWTGRLA